MNGFHLGGYDAYLDALRRESEQRTAALNDKLKQASSADEIKELEHQIRDESEDLKRRVAEARQSLF